MRDVEIAESARSEGRSEAIIEEYGDKSIAVLPFTDMSRTGDQQYLSDGLAEELLNLLAQVPELRVASRSSSFNLRNSDLSIPEMAARLGVAHILEGSVRLIDDQLRVTVQLIEAGSDTHLWSQNYVRKFENVFAIQDDVASNVVDQLKITLLGEQPMADEINPEAYALFLRARFLLKQLNFSRSYEIVSLLTQAVEIEPDYFHAWNMLGDIYQRQIIAGQEPAEKNLELSRHANSEAERIRPNDPDVHHRHGWMALKWDRDLEAAAIHIQKAQELTEDPMDKVSVSIDLLVRLGRNELPIKWKQYKLSRDPTIVSTHRSLGKSLIYAERYEEAIEILRKGLVLSPGLFTAYGDIAVSFLMLGRYEEALVAARNEVLPAMSLPLVVMALDELDRHEEAQAAFEEMIADENIAVGWQIDVYARRGDMDKAFEIIDKLSIKDGDFRWRQLRDPALNPLHSDPRWQLLVDEVGRYWVDPDTIEFHVPVPEELK